MAYDNIQVAVDSAAANDTILISPGIYEEVIDLRGKFLTLVGAGGPSATIIDGGRRGSVLRITGGAVVEGLTVRNGYSNDGGGIFFDGPGKTGVIKDNVIEFNEASHPPDFGRGGGIWLGYGSTSVIVQGNLIRDNIAGDSGGGLFDFGTDNIISNNVFSGNRAHVCGGALAGYGSIMEISHNLIYTNHADNFGAGICGGANKVSNNTVVINTTSNGLTHGAGLHLYGGSIVCHNLVVGNGGASGTSGVGILCEQSNQFITRLECNDSWDNSGGEYLIAASCDSAYGNNISVNPLFCEMMNFDFHLAEGSPCASDSPCGLIGALPVACGAVDVKTGTWGALKQRFHSGTDLWRRK